MSKIPAKESSSASEKKTPPPPADHWEDEAMTLLSWHAPGRPFKKHSREYFVNILLIMSAVEIILFLFAQYLLMLVVASLVFLAFVMATIPPREFHYRISTEGVLLEDHFYIWDELYDFYFLPQNGVQVLHIGTHAYFPGELLLTIGDVSADEIKEVLIHYLPFREYVKPSFIERAGNWLQHNFPLEKTAS